MKTKWDGVIVDTFSASFNLTKQMLYDTLMSLSQKDRNDIVCEALCNDRELEKAVVETFESWKQ